MQVTTRAIIFVAMIILTIVSMWTTYQSLYDSILPKPAIPVPLWGDKIWDCSVFALGLSVAIGLMLFGMKLAIIDEQKRLNLFGLVGMTIIAFISIAFNMDVLYRTADRDFFMQYSTNQVKSVYSDYLAQVHSGLTGKRDSLLKQIAKQEGELESEIKGLREAPAGYGHIARNEDYQLTILQKTNSVELQSIEQAIDAETKAGELLASTLPKTVQEIQTLQDQLRVAVKDPGAVAGIALPEAVETKSPLFTVFARLFDFKTVGIKEIFFVLIAIFLDLGDIIGYSMVPDRPKWKRRPVLMTIPEAMPGPEIIPSPSVTVPLGDSPIPQDQMPATMSSAAAVNESGDEERPSRRAFRFGRRW
ncbi:MAG: hypothetical protein HY706_05790 [Candidatus Hydrogenedentes bacterium]|nr:hypothetical protein [Candidatus Hydrogenedentota bacterium]